MQAKMPAILAGHGATDFDAYGIGYPPDQTTKFCALRYFAGGKTETEEKTLLETYTFTIHIQLPGIAEADVYKYMDGVNEYLAALVPEDFGFVSAAHSVETQEDSRAPDAEVLFYVTLSVVSDDCDK